MASKLNGMTCGGSVKLEYRKRNNVISSRKCPSIDTVFYACSLSFRI